MKKTIKRIVLVCMSFIMMFVACVNANAVWVTNWVEFDEFTWVETRMTLYNEEGVSAAVNINEAGYTYEIDITAECCTYYAEDDPTQSYDFWDTGKALRWTYDPSQHKYYIMNTTYFSTDILDIYYEFRHMHVRGSAIVFLCDYQFDESIGDYSYDAQSLVLSVVTSDDHSSDCCFLCSYED